MDVSPAPPALHVQHKRWGVLAAACFTFGGVTLARVCRLRSMAAAMLLAAAWQRMCRSGPGPHPLQGSVRGSSEYSSTDESWRALVPMACDRRASRAGVIVAYTNHTSMLDGSIEISVPAALTLHPQAPALKSVAIVKPPPVNVTVSRRCMRRGGECSCGLTASIVKRTMSSSTPPDKRHQQHSMRTRTAARAVRCQHGAFVCPVHLPAAVQCIIVDQLVAAHLEPEPDGQAVDAALYPHTTSLAWLLSLRLVCSEWAQHLWHQRLLLRRLRLEQLLQLSLLHDYAQLMVGSGTTSKQQRLQRVPHSVTLRFGGGSGSGSGGTRTVTLGVPEGGTSSKARALEAACSTAAGRGGAPRVRCGPGRSQLARSFHSLPQHALLLVADADALIGSGGGGNSSTVLTELLADVQALDARHHAHMALLVVSQREAAAGGAARTQPLHQLARHVSPLLRTTLHSVAMEGSREECALLFIPTVGFCRRMPLPADSLADSV